MWPDVTPAPPPLLHLTQASDLIVNQVNNCSKMWSTLSRSDQTRHHHPGLVWEYLVFTDILSDKSLPRTENPTALSICLYFYCGKPFLIEKFLQV